MWVPRTGMVPEVTTPGRHGGAEVVREDPVRLLKDFDSKMRSIQDVLSKYQKDRSTASASARGVLLEVEEEVDIDRAAIITSKRRQLQQQQLQARLGSAVTPGGEEEAYLRSVLAEPRLIKSAAPGATRVLSARIEYYRNNMELAQPSHTGSAAACARSRPGSGGHTHSAWAPLPGHGSPLPGYGSPLPGHGSPQPGYGSPQPGGGGAAAGPGAASPPMRSWEPTGDGEDPGASFFLTSVHLPSPGCNSAPQQHASLPPGPPGSAGAAPALWSFDAAAAAAGAGQRPPYHTSPHPAAPPPFSSFPARPATASGSSQLDGSTRVAYSPRSAGGGGPYGGESYGGGPPRRGGSAVVSTRRLRLALTSRPASGGSPTRRIEFVAVQAAVRADRAHHAIEVRERAAAIEAHRRRTIEQAADVRAAQRREEESRAAAMQAEEEMEDRQRQWTGIVGLCSKLSFLAEQIAEDRRVRSLRALRKEAAVKIATWYKSVLLRRRQRELVELIQRVRKLVRPYVAVQKQVIRQNCAMRLISFLQYAETSNMAVVGVRKLKTGVELLQNAWRNTLLVRKLQ
ncbi:hypothetical protein TSOC_000949, partial [Tetrabaena socialis]